jgi:hypothetical protein
VREKGNLPQHVSEVHPRVRVLNWSKGSCLPKESAVLLKEPFEGTAARSAIKPDGNLVDGSTNSGLEDKEQRS